MLHSPSLRRCIGVLQIATLIRWCFPVAAQVSAHAVQQAPPAYTLESIVSEVGLTFHTVGRDGLTIDDLKSSEIEILDDGVQAKILSFYAQQDRPIRAGIIIDTSESMEGGLAGNRAIATQFAQRILRPQGDEAFVEDFGYTAKIRQAWTGDTAQLTSAIWNGIKASENSSRGTSLFQTLFEACYSEMGKADELNAKLIVLFTDGEDNASHTDLEEAVQMCQQSNAAIYAFQPAPGPGYSGGPRNLAELTRQTGGRLFQIDSPEREIANDLDSVEKDVRNQYFLSFRPLNLKHDGSFHRLELKGPGRVDRFGVRSGYYDRKLTQAEVRPNGVMR